MPGRLFGLVIAMFVNLQMAIRSLVQNKLQAVLTLSGMSIGVAMVLFVSGLGLGAQRQIESQIEGSGPTLITIRAGNFTPIGIDSAGQQDSSGGELAEGGYGEDNFGEFSYERNAAMLAARQRAMAPKRSKVRSPARPLGLAELDLISTGINNVRAVSGSVSGNLNIQDSPNTLIRTVRVNSFNFDWPEIEGWKLLSGRMPSKRDHEQQQPMIVLTPVVAKRFYPETDAVDQSLMIAGQSFEIVGIVDTGKQDDPRAIVPAIYMPVDQAMAMLKQTEFDAISVRSASVRHTTEVASSITEQLRVLRELPDDTQDDFRVQTQSLAAMPGGGTDPRLARAVQANIVEFEQASWEEMATSLRQAGRTLNFLLAGAAAVCLLVGGIGVMNIMLVSVTARTREIGLRMAMGARVGDVLLQFVVEAITLAVAGGLIGLAIGGAGLFIARYILEWSTAISIEILLIAVLMSAATGLVFGYGPARRAAHLDPVTALKAE